MKRLYIFLLTALLPVYASAQNAPIVLTEGNRPSYCGATANFTMGGGAGDVIYIQGSATKAVRIVHTQISGTATAATDVDAQWARRTSAYSGGTVAAITGIKMDTLADPTATAVFNAVTSAITPGTNAGPLRTFKFLFNVATAAPSIVAEDFGKYNERAFVLHGTSEFLALNLSAVPAGGSLDVEVCWVEE